MEASEIRAQAEALNANSPGAMGTGATVTALLYALAVEAERLERARINQAISIAALEARVGALEEPLP